MTKATQTPEVKAARKETKATIAAREKRAAVAAAKEAAKAKPTAPEEEAGIAPVETQEEEVMPWETPAAQAAQEAHVNGVPLGSYNHPSSPAWSEFKGIPTKDILHRFAVQANYNSGLINDGKAAEVLAATTVKACMQSLISVRAGHKLSMGTTPDTWVESVMAYLKNVDGEVPNAVWSAHLPDNDADRSDVQLRCNALVTTDAAVPTALKVILGSQQQPTEITTFYFSPVLNDNMHIMGFLVYVPEYAEFKGPYSDDMTQFGFISISSYFGRLDVSVDSVVDVLVPILTVLRGVGGGVTSKDLLTCSFTIREDLPSKNLFVEDTERYSVVFQLIGTWPCIHGTMQDARKTIGVIAKK